MNEDPKPLSAVHGRSLGSRRDRTQAQVFYGRSNTPEQALGWIPALPSSGFMRRFGDLFGCIAVATVMLAFSVASLNNAVTLAFGVLLVFLVPGYALSCLLWGSESGLDGGDRLIFAVGLSVSLTVLSVLLLSLTGSGIYPLTVTLALAYEGLVFSVGALALRSARHEGIPRDLAEGFIRLRRGVGSDKPFWLVVAVLMLAAAVLVAMVVTTPPLPLSTQFYIAGPDGSSSSLPTVVVVNRTASLIVGAYNGAKQTVTFTVTVCLAVANVSCPGAMGPYANWSSVLELSPNSTVRLNLTAGPDARVEMPLQFLATVPGAYVMSLTLEGAGVQRDVRLSLQVTP